MTTNTWDSLCKAANNAKYAGRYEEAARCYRAAAAIELYPDVRQALLEAADECRAKVHRESARDT